MSDTIQVKYDELTAMARQFAQIADRAQGVQKALKSQVELVQAKGWQSPTATRFFDELTDDILPAFDRFHKAMAETQTTIQGIAQNFQAAEQESEGLIKGGEGGAAGVGSTAGQALVNGAKEAVSGGTGTGGTQTPAVDGSGRTPQALNSAIDSFKVETAHKYAKGHDPRLPNGTYCNIFASDVVKSLGAPLPQSVGSGKNIMYLDADRMKYWLDGTLKPPAGIQNYKSGPESGWVKIDHTQAAQAANNGHVVVVAGSDHMAVVRAGTPEGAGKGDVIISQAGAQNFNSGPLKKGWGTSKMGQAEFYIYKPQK